MSRLLNSERQESKSFDSKLLLEKLDDSRLEQAVAQLAGKVISHRSIGQAIGRSISANVSPHSLCPC